MIVDSNNTINMTQKSDNPTTQPPSYDAVVSEMASSGPYVAEGATKGSAVNVPPSPRQRSYPGPMSSPPPASAGPYPTTTVYNYVNPVTGEHVASLLPPDHPQMICLQQGGHVVRTQFGLLGILAAIFWFPFGIACCLLDRKVTCARCGAVLEEGPCG